MELETESIKPLMAHHLQELIADVELYGCELVGSYAVWFQQVKMAESSGMRRRPSFSFAMPWSGSQPPLRLSPVQWATQHSKRKEERSDQHTALQQRPALKHVQLSIKGTAQTRLTIKRTYISAHMV